MMMPYPLLVPIYLYQFLSSNLVRTLLTLHNQTVNHYLHVTLNEKNNDDDDGDDNKAFEWTFMNDHHYQIDRQ